MILNSKMDVYLNKMFNIIIAYEENCVFRISDGAVTLKELRLIESVSLLVKEHKNTPSKIAAYVFITPSTLSSMTKKLENRGYLKKIQSPGDRRVSYLIPTEKGEELVTYHAAFHNKLFNMIVKESNEAEQLGLIRILHIVEKYFTGEEAMDLQKAERNK